MEELKDPTITMAPSQKMMYERFVNPDEEISVLYNVDAYELIGNAITYSLSSGKVPVTVFSSSSIREELCL